MINGFIPFRIQNAQNYYQKQPNIQYIEQSTKRLSNIWYGSDIDKWAISRQHICCCFYNIYCIWFSGCMIV